MGNNPNRKAGKGFGKQKQEKSKEDFLADAEAEFTYYASFFGEHNFTSSMAGAVRAALHHNAEGTYACIRQALSWTSASGSNRELALKEAALKVQETDPLAAHLLSAATICCSNERKK